MKYGKYIFFGVCLVVSAFSGFYVGSYTAQTILKLSSENRVLNIKNDSLLKYNKLRNYFDSIRTHRNLTVTSQYNLDLLKKEMEYQSEK